MTSLSVRSRSSSRRLLALSALAPLLSLASFAGLPACDVGVGATVKPSANSASAPPAKTANGASASASASAIASAAPSASPLAPPAVAPPASDVAKLADATVSLADDLLARLDGASSREAKDANDASANVVYAPASISAALAMTYGGARGPTAVELAKTLHFDALGDEKVHLAWNQLLASWSSRATDNGGEEPRLDVANRLFGQKDDGFLPAFVALTRDRYGAPIEPVDYRGATESARLRINQWVSDRTAKAIPSLLAPGILSPASRLALVNAVHLKGAWAQPFVPEATRRESFESTPGTKVDVPTMHGLIDTRFVDGKDAQIVALPFHSAGALDLEVDVVLPRAPTDGAAAAKPSVREWAKSIDAAGWAEVSLSLPRFKIGSSFELSSTLAAMGMPSAFGAGADFSGMTGTKDLFVSAVVHQAVLDVNESGAEASAATAVVMTDKGMPAYVPMRVDRPFYVMIRDHKSGAVLFVAHVRTPAARA
jgi:serpin B